MSAKTDEQLVLDYLCGRFQKSKHAEIFRYLKPGSAREKRARQVLFRLLRNSKPLSPAISWELSSLIYPEGSPAEVRRFVFAPAKKGKRGAPAKLSRDVNIAMFIAKKTSSGGKIDAAVADAAEHYGVGKSTAYNAWKKHKRRAVSAVRPTPK
jgi:hypothetical protein